MIPTKDNLFTINLEEAQANLESLPGSKNNVFGDNIWQFENQRGRLITIDFNDILDIGKQYPNWSLSKDFDWVLLSKRIWLSYVRGTSPNLYVNRVTGLKLLWSAMAHYNLSQLTRENCSTILSFLLTYTWREGGPKKNPTIKSYNTFSTSVQIKAIKRDLADFHLELISQSVTDLVVKKHLQQLVPELTDNDLTYRDWVQGKSYDLLTLDHGRYYVEHSFSFFEEHYPLAIALASIIRSAPALAESLDYKLSTIVNVLPQILRGASPEEIQSRWPSWSAHTIKKIHEEVTQQFEIVFKHARFQSMMLQDNTLVSFVTDLGLHPSFENIDRMRIILWHWMQQENKNETLRLLEQCQPYVSWKDFQKVLIKFKDRCNKKPCSLPSDEYYMSIGLFKNRFRDSSNIYPRQLIRFVAAAGLTSVVALTGWRKSEYGFPLSKIKRTRNNDGLDEYAFPWRYQVDWYVYKTAGKVREIREITFGIYLIAERLQLLSDVSYDQPCLYEVTLPNNDPFDSSYNIQRGVRILWAHFVNHYFGFKLLDNHTCVQSLQLARDSGSTLTPVEEEKINRLLATHSVEDLSNFLTDTNLTETWRRVRDESSRVNFFLLKSTKQEKKNWLVNYSNGTLASDLITLLNAHLSEGMKDWIQSLPNDELSSRFVTKVVTNDFMENTIYPSSHAFRHMWAESVYRRFDGDVGWMIRSQFKHVARVMWLDYIRDKDNRPGHDKAKEQVISSLVHNYLKHKGVGYSGQLHIWLRRLLFKTSVVSPDEQQQLAERLATVEIENIKSNPWGYCLLKRRTRNKAKCAVMGEPMRHNASPDLCLGCIHNLMQTENVEWTLFHAASHVETLKNPVVPKIFKASSYELVKNVTRHVRTLDAGHEGLSELQEILDNYKV